MLPTGYDIKHIPHPGSRIGEGVALIYKSMISVKILQSTKEPVSGSPVFEYIDCDVKIGKALLRPVVIYRPPPSIVNKTALIHF